MVSCSGSLVQSCCGEEGALQTNVTGVCRHSQCSGHNGFALAHGYALSPSTLLRPPGCSIWSRPCIACGSGFRVFHKSTDSVVPAFCAFSGKSSSGSQELYGCTLPRCSVPSSLHGPSLSFRPRWSGVCALCLAATLPADVDHPESQEVFG